MGKQIDFGREIKVNHLARPCKSVPLSGPRPYHPQTVGFIPVIIHALLWGPIIFEKLTYDHDMTSSGINLISDA
jgi:hypothetical protein